MTISPPPRVTATPATVSLIETLVSEYGPVLFHQSGGCCDGSAPMCYARGDLLIGENDVFLGEIGDQPFYIGRAQFEYWRHTQLIIDVVEGRGGMFSLENSRGVRFLTRSRVFTDAETEALDVLGVTQWVEASDSTHACIDPNEGSSRSLKR